MTVTLSDALQTYEDSMESDDDRHRLPEFTFHEACLLTVQLTAQGLPDLHIAPEPTVRDELQKKTQREADAVVQGIKQKVGRFLAGLRELNPSEFWDLDELRPKLESLSEMQFFGLYFALKKYFWEFEKHPTQAEALCDAGFFSKEKLPFAQRVEALDRRRRQLS
jgi:hypothetical protein